MLLKEELEMDGVRALGAAVEPDDCIRTPSGA